MMLSCFERVSLELWALTAAARVAFSAARRSRIALAASSLASLTAVASRPAAL